MIRPTSFLFATMALFAFAVPSEAAEFWSTRQNNLIYVEMTGQVARGDGYRFERAVSYRRPATASRVVLAMRSPGGRVDGMWEMIRGIDRLQTQLPVQVVVRGRCESACADIFLAAKERFMEPGGKLGFHAAGFRGQELYDDMLRSANYYEERGVPTKSAILFATTPNWQMLYVSADQANKLGISRILTPTPRRNRSASAADIRQRG